MKLQCTTLASTYVFLNILLLTIPAASAATELWNDAIVGMTEIEIRELFPEVNDADNDRPILPGANKELVLPEAEYFGYPFESEFFFSAAGLVQVVLTNSSLEKKRHIRKACTNLKSALQNAYGVATASRVTKSMLGTSDYSIYGNGDVIVKLTCDAMFRPLRVVFQSRNWLSEYSPFGLPMGMSTEGLLAYVDDPLPETTNEQSIEDKMTDVVLEAALSHVPQVPPGEGNLQFNIRASKRNGLCYIKATLRIAEDEGMEYLFSKASLMPNSDLFGTPSEIGGMFGAFKFSFIPKPIVQASSDLWARTVDEDLPGSIDKMVYLSGSTRIDGVKTTVESVRILFTNASTCGLSRDDLAGLE